MYLLVIAKLLRIMEMALSLSIIRFSFGICMHKVLISSIWTTPKVVQHLLKQPGYVCQVLDFS